MILDLKNNGLHEATTNHEQVVVFYLYKKEHTKTRRLKNGGLSKSL